MKEYDKIKMSELLRDFYTLTGVKTCLFDSAGKEIAYYPEKLSAYCALLRQNSELDERCVKCDKTAFAECKKTRKRYSYVCHAGLTECVSPIIYDDKIIGYILIGQAKTEKSAFTDAIASKFPASSRADLAEAFERLPVADSKIIRSAMSVLDACAGYEYLKSLLKTSEKRTDTAIDDYVTAHVGEDLSIKRLRSVFKLSNTELYAIFEEFFNSTPAEFIKKRRLSYACELLVNSDLPISVISEKCGICDYNYFSKVFKKEIKISPREYRKANSIK